MQLTAEQNQQRIDRLRDKQRHAHDNAVGLQNAIRSQLADGRALGGLAAQYDEAIIKYKLYAEELYEATT